MRRTQTNGCTLLLTLLVACGGATVQSGGITVYKSWWDRATNELRYQAAPDLGCTPEGLSFTLVEKQGKVPTKVFAEGCGGSALYARRLRRHGPLGRHTDRNTHWERMN